MRCRMSDPGKHQCTLYAIAPNGTQTRMDAREFVIEFRADQRLLVRLPSDDSDMLTLRPEPASDTDVSCLVLYPGTVNSLRLKLDLHKHARACPV